MNLFAEEKKTHRLLKNLWLPKGRGGEVREMDWGFGTDLYTLRYME